MNRIVATRTTLAVVLLSILAACNGGITTEQAGTATGAVVGGAVGNELGGPAATIGGAAAGAVVGKEAGEEIEDDRHF